MLGQQTDNGGSLPGKRLPGTYRGSGYIFWGTNLQGQSLEMQEGEQCICTVFVCPGRQGLSCDYVKRLVWPSSTPHCSPSAVSLVTVGLAGWHHVT